MNPQPYEIFTCSGSSCEIIIQAIIVYASMITNGNFLHVFNGGSIEQVLWIVNFSM